MKYLRRPVSRVVVHYNDVEGKTGLLLQRTLHGIGNGLLTIVDRNDDRSLHSEVLLVEVGLLIG